MITATPYFLSRLATSPLRPAFSSYLSISYQAVNFLMLIYTTATAATASKTYRIRVSSTVLALLFFVLTLSTVSGSSGTSYFVFIMIIDALLALGASVLNTTVVALAALFGPGAMQACFAGQAAVGVVVSALQFLGAFFSSVADSKPEGETGAQVGPAAAFFALSTVFVLLSLIAHSLLLRTPEYTDVVSQWEAGNVLLVEEPDRPDYSDEEEAGQEEHRSILSPVDDFGVEVPQVKNRVSIWEVAKINKSYNLAVGFCFAVTLSVFPPITAYVTPTNPSPTDMLTPALFTALHFLVYNVGDYFGRFICAYPAVRMWGRRQLGTYSLARLLLIPLLLMCNVRAPGGELIGIGGDVPLINSDLAFFALVALLGITNGHCCSLCMMAASSTEHNGRIRTEQVDTAAAVAQFSLVGGLVTGSMASFAVRRMVCACNPFLG